MYYPACAVCVQMLQYSENALIQSVQLNGDYSSPVEILDKYDFFWKTRARTREL